MFVKSIKLSRKRLILGAVVVVAVIAGGIWFSSSRKAVMTAGKVTVSTEAKTPEQRQAFLKSFGWEVDLEPDEVTEVLIPTDFDDVYESYNVIQKKQGFDLSDYKGKRAKRWVYTVKNYPGGQTDVKATLLVVDDKIIGGDISSAEQGKFTHGFELEETD